MKKRIMFLILLGMFFIFPTISLYADEPVKAATKPIKIDLDGRSWNVGYMVNNLNLGMIEYILDGQTVEGWDELTTVQQFYGIQKETTPEILADKIKKQLEQKCLGYLFWTDISKDSNGVVAEWQTINCPGVENQDEILRVTSSDTGIWALHYVTKKIPFTDTIKQKWFSILKSSTLIDAYNLHIKMYKTSVNK